MPDPGAIDQVVNRGANAAARGARAAQSATNEGAQGASPLDVWTHTGEGLLPALGQTELFSGPVAPIESSASVDAIPGAMGQQIGAMKDAAANIGKADNALVAAGAVMNTLTTLEQTISIPLSAIPFPEFPAIRVLDLAFGFPHVHNHPPNLIPPAPPMPLPSIGPVLPIPFVSGASTVLINSMPAGRCGDIGLGIWCGGYFPLYEIFLGSSSVWIEGMRAARLGVDITKHCIFTSPKPNDPPMGLPIGFTITASTNVIIGGIPMPSLTMMAIAGATKFLFKGISKVVTGLQDWAKAVRRVAQLEKDGAILIRGEPKVVAAVKRDLQKIASTKAGRDLLDRIADNKAVSNTEVEIKALRESDKMANGGIGPRASPPPNIPVGTPTDTEIRYGPGASYPVGGPLRGGNTPQIATPSDVVLYHEIVHGSHIGEGTWSGHLPPRNAGFPNLEEENTVNSENLYRSERGLTRRQNYGHLP
jgi:uncharacterized Zn-binding protein involved in type VI secretion